MWTSSCSTAVELLLSMLQTAQAAPPGGQSCGLFSVCPCQHYLSNNKLKYRTKVFAVKLLYTDIMKRFDAPILRENRC